MTVCPLCVRVATGVWLAVGLVLVAPQSSVEVREMRETTATGFPLARVSRVEGAPDIDGDVLGEVIWDDAFVTTGFRQTTPDEG